jgi:hypothetical protein
LEENFDRFNFAIYKEKEMVDFRRWITAIAVLALFAGLACGQVIIGTSTGASAGPLTCTAAVSVPPQLRAEGLTELIGDIVIQCQGGTAIASGATIPTANITVSLGTNVTSRLLGTNNTSNASEALLLIDEPGSGGDGPGPAAAQLLCGSPSVGAGPGGCTQVSVGGGASTATGGGQAPNMYQGLVNANQVVFNGVPINPPVTGGFARVFRITNVRANVAGLGGGGLAGTTQLLASISISGSTSLPINNPVQIAGFVQSGLTTALRPGNGSTSSTLSAPALAQCAGASTAQIGLLTYSENFATAFKTRVNAAAPGAGGSGQSGSAIQNVPGTIYNSEAGFISPAGPSNSGMADYGTRLKAVFNSVPAGVRLFVSTTNVSNNFLVNPSKPDGTVTTTSFAQLVLSETAPDSFNSAPVVSSTTTVSGQSGNTLNLAEIPVVNGSATAVWEVINTNPASSETLNFGLWATFTANPGSNSPPAGTATVNMSFAPTPSVAFSATAGSAASSSLTVPRFADTSSGQNIFSIALCNTVLLYPFVTNQGGFDTGIAIANTSTDPFGTRTQSGTCDMNFYGASAPSAKVTTPNIATGTVYTTLASTSATGFQGYMIAVCQFQLAHGFAFISDLGARNLAMGYLALILPTGTGNRNSGNLLFNGSTSANVEDTAH